MNRFRMLAAALFAASIALVIAGPPSNASMISNPPATSAAPSGAASGDLSGTYPGPTVAKIKGTAVTTAGGSLTTGAVLRVTGVSSADYGAVDLTNSSAVTGILPTGNGGTGNGFFAVSGPATSAKTFTFPNASATVLTSNAAVTVAQGGTGVGTLTAHGPLVGEGTGNLVALTPGTAGQLMIGQGATSDPAFTSMTGDCAITSAGAISCTQLGGAFFAVSGPATSTKTFTFPNASATVLTSNAAVTVAQGGTGVGTLTAHGFLVGEGTSNVAATAACTAGQLPIGQGATSDPACESVTGDVAITSAGATTVGAISGSTPIAISPNELQWASGASPKLDQASESATTAAADLVLQPQQSTHTTDQTGGNLVISLQSPAGAGTEASLRLKRGATEIDRLGFVNGSIGALWLGNASTASNSNYAIQSTGNDTYFNGGSNLHLQVNNAEEAVISSTTMSVNVPIAGDLNHAAQWASSSSQSVTGSSVTLSNAQIMTPVIPLTGAINASNCTITVPNTVGAHWHFGLAAVTFGGKSLVFTTGSGTSATITAVKAGGYTLIECVVTSSNVVECG